MAAGRANGIKEEIRSLNAWLNSIECRVYEILNELNQVGELAVWLMLAQYEPIAAP